MTDNLLIHLPDHADDIWDAYVDCLLVFDSPDLYEARELLYRWAALCRVQPRYFFGEDTTRTFRVTHPDVFADRAEHGDALTDAEATFRERLPVLVNLALDLDGFQTWHEDLRNLPDLADDDASYAQSALDLFEDLDMADCVLWLAREVQIPEERVQPFGREVCKMHQSFIKNVDSFFDAADHAYLTLRCAGRKEKYGNTLAKHKFLCYHANGEYVQNYSPLRYPEYGAPPLPEIPEEIAKLLREVTRS